MFVKYIMTFAVVLLHCVCVCRCTIDINFNQLQMVADHLEEDECRRLSDALHQNTFELVKPFDGKNEPNNTCIFLLLKWDRTEGHGKTFNDLALRLGQIGRQDLADRLSKSVYSEKSEQLERKFLDDPFKKIVPKESFLLDLSHQNNLEDDDSGDDEEYVGFSSWEIFGIVCGVITCVGILMFFVVYLFGTVISRMCRRFAPEFMVTWFDMVSAQCKYVFKTTKRDYETQVIGSKKTDIEQRKSVMEMNRNLNNYLNGHLEDAFYYFQEN